jgi:hypothetical protein
MLDPDPVTMSVWADINSVLLFLGIYIVLIATFAASVLVGVAFIPSLVSTGHLPKAAMKLLPVAVAFGVLALIAAGVFLAMVVLDYQKVDDIYPRWFF